MTSKERLIKALRLGCACGICYCIQDEEFRKRTEIHDFMIAELKNRGWYDAQDPMFPIGHPEKDSEQAYYDADNEFSVNTQYTRRRRTIAKLVLKEFYGVKRL